MKKIIITSTLSTILVAIIIICILNITSNNSNANSKKESSKDLRTAEVDGPIDISYVSKIMDSKDGKDILSNATSDKDSDKKDSEQEESVYTKIVEEYGCTQAEYDVFCHINDYRKKNGLNEVEWSDELYRAATIRAKEIVSTPSHTRPDGSSCFTASDAMSRENLAYGSPTSKRVFELWVESTGHRENILAEDNKYCAIGLHITNSDYRYYWINVFGR